MKGRTGNPYKNGSIRKEKIMKKRLVSLILATLLIFTSIPAISVHASAATTEDGLVYSISDGEVTITAYTGSAAELVITTVPLLFVISSSSLAV